MATSESGQSSVPPGDTLPEYEDSAEENIEGEQRTCCEEEERTLRALFEERIAKLERTREEKKNDSVEIMKELIIVSDEQLAVAKFKLEERSEAIEELRKMVMRSEE